VSARDITAAINLALRKRYCSPEWALLFNVADGTGAVQTRFADAVAMSLWPSRGLELHGMEVKASRNDWQKERSQPDKAETIAAFCDHWWLVAAKGVAKEDEIPPAWGWIEYDDGKLVTVKKSVKTEALAMTRSFLAALLRRASEADEVMLKEAIKVADKEREDRFEKQVAREVKYKTDDAERLRAAVERFEQASGVKIDTYGGGEIGAAVKAIMGAGLVSTYGNMHELADKLVEGGEKVRAALAEAGIEPPEQHEMFKLVGRRK
jgi:hypothetical protein